MNHTQHKRLTRVICLLLALTGMLTIHSPVFAQTDQGRIVGTVDDPNGAVVPGATITVRNERTGEERTATASDEGLYIVPALKPSFYTVTVSASNFKTTTNNNVQLLVGQELNLNLQLQTGEVSESVTIQGGSEVAINTESASLSANVNPREVEGLPLNGRQLSQLYLQAPGSVNSGSGTFGDIRFNGRAVEQNIIRYDGIEGTAIIDASPGNLNGEVPSPFRLQSSLENVQEFRVESSNYTAEYGTGTGGQINVVTKSGGNQFRGSLFEYFRNDWLDAANYFDNIVGSKSPLRLNQFGGSIGGPVLRDKLFFFGSYEGYRGRFGINSVEAAPQLRFAQPGALIPGTTTPVNPSAQLLIPAFRAPGTQIISSGADNLFDVVQLQSSAIVNENAYAARLDYRINQNNTLNMRYFRDQGFNDQPEGVTGRRVTVTAVPQNGVVALQSVLSPTLINEVKFGYNGVYTRVNGFAPTVNGIDLSRITVNLSGNTANFAIAGQGTSAGTANPGGLVRANSATNGRAQPYTVYSLSFIDNLNYTRGNHDFKFGVEFRPNRIYTDRLGGTTYVFNNLTQFLANTPASIQYIGDLSDPSPFTNVSGNRLAKSEYYIGFAQDTWKIRPNLTLAYGLRYEYYTPLREASNGDVLFDTVNGALLPPDRAFFKTTHNFGPRVGFTYSPRPNSDGFFGGGRTVLRAGFGIYYGPGQVEDQIQPIESDRVSSTISSGALLTFNPDQAAFINAVRANFVANPNNRVYQPRAYSPDYTVPEKIYQYTVSVQQELPYKLVGTIAYVGSQGRNLFLRGLSNTLRPGQTTILDGAPLPNGFGVINRTNAAGQVIGVTSVRQFDILSGTTVQRPFAEIDTKTSGGTDSYNALQLQLARRLSSGLTMNAQYTFSRSFGNTSGSNEARTASEPVGGSGPPGSIGGDINNYEADRGYNTFDVRHTFNMSAVYTLPVGDGKRFDLGNVGNAIFRDFEVGAILNARSGLPVDVTVVRPEVVIQNPTTGEVRSLPSAISATSPLPAGFIAVVNAPGGGASRQTRRPDLISGVSPYLGTNRQFINPAAFAIPAPGAFGNLPRNALRGPNFSQLDFIINKRFRIGETRNIEFRTEIFNVLNHANFANPASTLNSALGTGTNQLQPGQPFTQAAAGSTFGLLRQTVERTVGLGTNRQIQFALRLNF